MINFNAPEYIAVPRNKLRISDSKLRSVEYGLYIQDDSLNPFYQKGDVLLIQSIQKIKKEVTLLFASDGGIKIETCFSESDEPESVFNFINTTKKELIAYGKILYRISNEPESVSLTSN